jgi:hypothetical protein
MKCVVWFKREITEEIGIRLDIPDELDANGLIEKHKEALAGVAVSVLYEWDSCGDYDEMPDIEISSRSDRIEFVEIEPSTVEDICYDWECGQGIYTLTDDGIHKRDE